MKVRTLPLQQVFILQKPLQRELWGFFVFGEFEKVSLLVSLKNIYLVFQLNIFYIWIFPAYMFSMKFSFALNFEKNYNRIYICDFWFNSIKNQSIWIFIFLLFSSQSSKLFPLLYSHPIFSVSCFTPTKNHFTQRSIIICRRKLMI